jgi:hypothetical protein
MPSAIAVAAVSFGRCVQMARHPYSASEPSTRSSCHNHRERVFFNGAKAADLFRRLADAPHRIRCQRLPSTSPAHTMPLSAELAAWQAIC